MSSLFNLIKTTLPISVLFLASCQTINFTELSKKFTGGEFTDVAADGSVKGAVVGSSKLANVLSLEETVAMADPKINVDGGFSDAMAKAIKFDPDVQMAKANIAQVQANLGVTKSKLDFQFSGTVYAGAEDITDDINGIAAVLRASKMIYDGGQLSNTISAGEYAVQSALENYRGQLENGAFLAGKAWVELERFRSLNELIATRLSVLDPLIMQLERVADAGVGDATQVAAAQRTVSMIRVTEANIDKNLAQAEINFIRIFGKLPNKSSFNADLVANAVPNKVTQSMVLKAPKLLERYSAYMGSLNGLAGVRALKSVNVGFETKVQRPFGNSAYDNDESIGLVLRKTFYDGDEVKSRILAAQAEVAHQESSVKSVYLLGKESVEEALQSIASMERGISLARDNSVALKGEIAFLRKQLVIGQSSLDSVLTAEARLYDSGSMEINSISEGRTAQLALLSAIGRLSPLFGVSPESELN
jgi:outer membrane protein TolC